MDSNDEGRSRLLDGRDHAALQVLWRRETRSGLVLAALGHPQHGPAGSLRLPGDVGVEVAEFDCPRVGFHARRGYAGADKSLLGPPHGADEDHLGIEPLETLPQRVGLSKAVFGKVAIVNPGLEPNLAVVLPVTYAPDDFRVHDFYARGLYRWNFRLADHQQR